MRMATVVARRRQGYTHDIEIEGGHALVIDEPVDAGGSDEGPAPTRVLAAALASCTAITVEMYAARKRWELGQLEVEVEMGLERSVPVRFDVTMRCPGAALDDEEYERLRVIASKCPVHKALAANTEIVVVDRIVPA